MDNTETLLLFLHQNTRMGIDNLTEMLKIAEEGTPLYEILENQRKGYVNMHDVGKELLQKEHLEPTDPPALPKMWSFISLHMQTLTDKSPEKLAALLIEGSTMGIIDIQHHINTCQEASEEALAMATTLMRFQEGAIAKFKEFL